MKKALIFLLLFHFLSLQAQHVDIDLLREFNLNRNRQLDNTFRIITHSVTPASIGMPVVLFGLGAIQHNLLLKQNAMYTGAAGVTAVVFTFALKYTINKPRPYTRYPDIEKATSARGPSFPSGHTSAAFSLATSLSLAYPKWYVMVPAFAWAGAVGYSRMHLGVHYPGDVLAGAVAGAGSAYLCYKSKQWLYRK